MTQEYNEKQIQLIDYLKTAIGKGLVYFKAKHIASDLGVPSREVGANLSILSHGCPEFEIVRWGYSGTSTTWKITEPAAA
ncbi:MAG TPA: hypothetical protein O0X97_04875 [Methanocorpusculum sp.]|nr:hypothetical protein [Methanocorpusculum sp.]